MSFLGSDPFARSRDSALPDDNDLRELLHTRSGNRDGAGGTPNSNGNAQSDATANAGATSNATANSNVAVDGPRPIPTPGPSQILESGYMFGRDGNP
jgi:hypothetical protein